MLLCWQHGRFFCIFLGEEKLVAPLIAIPNVDKANRRQKERQKTKLALCVIRMQNGNGKLHFCKLIGQSPSTELPIGGFKKGEMAGTAMVPAI